MRSRIQPAAPVYAGSGWLYLDKVTEVIQHHTDFQIAGCTMSVEIYSIRPKVENGRPFSLRVVMEVTFEVADPDRETINAIEETKGFYVLLIRGREDRLGSDAFFHRAIIDGHTCVRIPSIECIHERSGSSEDADDHMDALSRLEQELNMAP